MRLSVSWCPAPSTSTPTSIIQAGTCRLENSLPVNPICSSVPRPKSGWVVTRGELDGQQAFFQKAYQAEGDLGLLIRMKILFSGGVAVSGGKIQSAKTGFPE